MRKAWGRRFNTKIHSKVPVVLQAWGGGFRINVHKKVLVVLNSGAKDSTHKYTRRSLLC